MPFVDRRDAGRRLGLLVRDALVRDARARQAVGADAAPSRAVVVGMARGGVPVAFEVAEALGAPLDVVVVRKLGHPLQPELGVGAIGEDGVCLVNETLVAELNVTPAMIDAVAARERSELERRLHAYRGGRPPVDVGGRTAVVVDDGIATGFTARAAVAVMRHRDAARVVLGVPVGPPGAVAALGEVADEVVCVEITERFFGISQWYSDFRQVGDDEVASLLALARGVR
ncbi:MAG: phosphoribosyltransferase family protein [Acidimicrobiales bacterium]